MIACYIMLFAFVAMCIALPCLYVHYEIKECKYINRIAELQKELDEMKATTVA